MHALCNTWSIARSVLSSCDHVLQGLLGVTRLPSKTDISIIPRLFELYRSALTTATRSRKKRGLLWCLKCLAFISGMNSVHRVVMDCNSVSLSVGPSRKPANKRYMRKRIDDGTTPLPDVNWPRGEKEVSDAMESGVMPPPSVLL